MFTRYISAFLFLMLLSELTAEGFAEFRPTFFYPASHRARKIFGNGLYENQFEAGFWSYPDWTVWGNVGYLKSNGSVKSTEEKINASLTTFSGGASYHFPVYLKCPGWNGYLGAGPLLGRLNTCGHYREAWGGVVKFGLFYKFHPWGHLNVFCDYNQLVFSYHPLGNSTKGNLIFSGFKSGIGFAAEF